ncbi:MAG: O-methyltransferase, partial [Vicinamibacterales bacterium]
SDDVLDAALNDSTAAGLPAINVTPAQGKFLALLAQLCRARRILEIGTLGGYSTIWMARALPIDGRLITLEIDPRAAAVAKANLERAGVANRVQVVIGRAAESLARLISDKVQPFDLVFIDADKQNSTVYFEATLALSHAGTVIIVDNVVREGAIIDAFSADTNVLGMRQLTEWLGGEPRLSATAIQTVGSKGYDGFIMALVKP